MGEAFAKSVGKEESFCLARKDPFQNLSVEAMSPLIPVGALAASPAFLSCRTMSRSPVTLRRSRWLREKFFLSAFPRPTPPLQMLQ